ncbi:NADP-dependent oxidoreductase [Microbacterium allomyrinae]|uniref:NADP-dependent oxidoreductase n=1 Tax=Microbacterium allomyrinae TaxID=2830666 RepID=A0A9X1LVX3_9MICO|nr:NADP-dependent oxidoreductase [Microbacterium allomyrinae]MCC2033040.1 NADP-dependent oxidoreductase [Microbacterium allomyrinae]
MQRIQYHRYGGPEVLRLEDVEPRGPGPGEVLVRVHAASANPMDWKIRDGMMPAVTGRTFPRGFGTDFAGVIEAVGTNVTRLGVGDEVLGGTTLQGPGAFAAAVVAEQARVVKKPSTLSFEQAAAIPTVGVTAFQAIIREGMVNAGQAVFIHGCLGGVGRAAVQFARSRGASVAGSCRPVDTEEARALGIDPIVRFDFDPDSLTGGFDLVLDTAGTLSAKTAGTIVKRGGRILDINPTPAKFARAAVPGEYRVMVAQAVTADLEAVAEAAGQGALQVPIGRIVSLSEAITALTELEVSHFPRNGKLIAVPD